jgi:hypothetical protein
MPKATHTHTTPTRRAVFRGLGLTARTGASIDSGAPVLAFGTRADRLTGHHGQESMTSTEDVDSDKLGGSITPKLAADDTHRQSST